MRSIIVIAHNIRSIHNVGSILRTCDGFGIERVYCSGYTPYPAMVNDTRLPHIARKITDTLHKTALGAELTVTIRQVDTANEAIQEVIQQGYSVVGLEQTQSSVPLELFSPPDRIALIIGEEVNGISQTLQDMCNSFVEIPMLGQKESFNVSVATGIALYHLRISK